MSRRQRSASSSAEAMPRPGGCSSSRTAASRDQQIGCDAVGRAKVAHVRSPLPCLPGLSRARLTITARATEDPFACTVFGPFACRGQLISGRSRLECRSLCGAVCLDHVGNQLSRLFEVVHHDNPNASWWRFGKVVVETWIYFF